MTLTDTRIYGGDDFGDYVGRLRRLSENITVINKKQEKRARFYYNRLQSLTIWYMLYQIIAFASLGTSSSVRCDRWWVPFSLSLVPAILYFAVLREGLTSYHEIQCELDTCYKEQERIDGLIREAESQKVRNDAVLSIIDGEHVVRPDGFVVLKRLVCIWTVVLMLVGFTVVVLCSPRVVLRRR